jgi:hypothetical protein
MAKSYSQGSQEGEPASPARPPARGVRPGGRSPRAGGEHSTTEE